MNDQNKSGNPLFRSTAFTQGAITSDDRMTVNGTISKAFIMLILMTIAASWVWGRFLDSGTFDTVLPYVLGGGLIAFILAMVTGWFKPAWSPITAPVYAICEGLFLGGISAIFELRWPGIVIQAVGLTL